MLDVTSLSLRTPDYLPLWTTVFLIPVGMPIAIDAGYLEFSGCLPVPMAKFRATLRRGSNLAMYKYLICDTLCQTQDEKRTNYITLIINDLRKLSLKNEPFSGVLYP